MLQGIRIIKPFLFELSSPPDKKSRIVGEPIFGTEQRYLPIQAADMYAWWSRRRYLEAAFGWPRTPLPRLPQILETGVPPPILQEAVEDEQGIARRARDDDAMEAVNWSLEKL